VDEQRVPWDMTKYLARVCSTCYVCELLAGNPEFFYHVAYRDDTAIVFLCKYPALRGHLMVAPIAHREQVVGDFDEAEYLHLQSIVHRAGRALERLVATERLCVLSLGSQEGNGHVHWHLVPLPPGVPYEDQQLAALDESRGWLDLSFDDLADLAEQIGLAIESRHAITVFCSPRDARAAPRATSSEARALQAPPASAPFIT
jgi:diadenosine tetraphosphate (Ap4A) HIT family hydrolase